MSPKLISYDEAGYLISVAVDVEEDIKTLALNK